MHLSLRYRKVPENACPFCVSDLQKRYKLKLTGELLEDRPGEVSFLGRGGGERRP